MTRDRYRAEWTALVEGTKAVNPTNKYGAVRTEYDGKKYASKHEAEVAANLATLERAGKIKELREQVRIVLVPSDGKLRAVVYVADFQYRDLDGFTHVLDAKGFKTPVYRIKKRMAAMLLHLTIEEV